MKGRCYPKYSYIIFYVLSIVLLIFALAPIFIGRNDNIYIRIGWSIFMLSGSIICFFGALKQMQTFELKDNVITIRTAFGVLIEMDLKNVTIEIVELDTYFSWVTIIQKKWICFYEKNRKIDKFKHGCSNKRNEHRMQIIYSEALMQILKIGNAIK